MEQYPTLNFLISHGRPIGIAALILGLGAGLWGTIASGNWGWACGGILAGVFGFGLIRSYVELVCLVTDMLMPK
jgi:hypothetical protein